MSDFTKTARNEVKRIPARGAYDKETIYAILDEAPMCHLGFVQDGKPVVIPTIHARLGDELLFHGAKTSRLIKHIQAGNDVCVTVTLLDGLVLARSAFHHSMNYRSAVIFGKGRVVEDKAERMAGFRAIVEHVMPGRWDEARKPNAKELAATGLAAVSLESASAKIRTGPPHDDKEDMSLPIWAGVVPIRQTVQEPIDDPALSDGICVPEYVREFRYGGIEV